MIKQGIMSLKNSKPVTKVVAAVVGAVAVAFLWKSGFFEKVLEFFTF